MRCGASRFSAEARSAWKRGWSVKQKGRPLLGLPHPTPSLGSRRSSHSSCRLSNRSPTASLDGPSLPFLPLPPLPLLTLQAYSDSIPPILHSLGLFIFRSPPPVCISMGAQLLAVLPMAALCRGQVCVSVCALGVGGGDGR